MKGLYRCAGGTGGAGAVASPLPEPVPDFAKPELVLKPALLQQIEQHRRDQQ